MKNTTKILLVAMFAIIAFSSLASAVEITSPINSDLSQIAGDHTFTIKVESTSNETVTISVDPIEKDSKTITFISQDIDLVAGVSQDVTISYNVPTDFNFDFSDGQVTSTIRATGAITGTQEVRFTESTYCGDKNEEDASIDLTIDDINVVSGFGDDDNYWYLKDTVEVDVVFDDPKYDIENIDIEWELWSNGKMIDDGDDSMSDVDEGDDDTVTLTITLDRNMDDYDDSAVLYVRAVGKINDKDDTIDGKKACESDSQTIDINLDKNFVIADELKINDEDFDYTYTMSCDQEITLSGELTNIGTKDQDDVYVEFYNKALDIYKRFDFDEIKSFDSEDFSFTFKVPEDLDAANYKLTVEVFDDNNDLFENDEDDLSKQTIQFKLDESCKTIQPTVNVKALDVTPKSGEDMKVTATITNMNEKSVIYTTNAEGFQDWALLKEVSPEVVSLAKGESKDVTFTFEVKKDVEGDKFFNIETFEGGESVLSQPVSVTVEKATLGFGSLDELFTKKNLQIIGIVALNLILIIFIILVAHKILKKK